MDSYTKLIFEVAELKRQLANMLTPGSIKEVKGDKVRMTLGKDNDGKDVLGPWISTHDRRGGARARNSYKEGQNGWLFSPTGDPSQSVWIPGGPNKKFNAPDHADDSDEQEQGGGGGGGQGGQQGQQQQKKDEETYQQDHFRKKFTSDGGVWFRQKPQEQKQDQQQQQQGNQDEDGDNAEMPKRKKQDPDGDQIVRMHKEDGVEGRDGKGNDAAKFTAHKKGARIRKGKVYVVTEPSRILLQGAIAYFEKPPRIKKIPDPIPNDDKTDV